jgi:hypothetical protein
MTGKPARFAGALPNSAADVALAALGTMQLNGGGYSECADVSK